MFLNKFKQVTALALSLSLLMPSGLFAQENTKKMTKAEVNQIMNQASILGNLDDGDIWLGLGLIASIGANLALQKKNLKATRAANDYKVKYENMTTTRNEIFDELLESEKTNKNLRAQIKSYKKLEVRERELLKELSDARAKIPSQATLDKVSHLGEYQARIASLERELAETQDKVIKTRGFIYESAELKAIHNQIVEDLIKEGKVAQSKLASNARIISAQDDVTRAILKVNTNMERFEASAVGAQADDAAKTALKAIEQLKALKVPNATTKQMVNDFINSATKRLKGKGGAAGAVLVMIGGTAAMLMTSADASAQVISNNRIAVEKMLNKAYADEPQMLPLQAAILSQKYGSNLVSGVIYENQDAYIPIIEEQIEISKLPAVQNYMKELKDSKQQFAAEASFFNWGAANFKNTEKPVQIPYR